MDDTLVRLRPAGRVDVHHHFNASGGVGGRLDWTPERAVEEMDAAGVGFAVGWPGPVYAADVCAARARAKLLNEFGAGIVRRWPERFGLFATLPPLEDTDGALAEIADALDRLKADGIGLITQYGDRWLGDPLFRPVFEELNRRAAVVFVHPQSAQGGCACEGYQSDPITAAWLEYPFNTARTILSMMTAGVIRAYPHIRFIFCHGGGAFTSLIGRIEGFRGWVDIGPETMDRLFPQGVLGEFRQLHFEIAQACAPQNMVLLRSLVPDSQILFGTDYDRFPLTHTVQQFEALDLPVSTRSAIEGGNARRLFARAGAAGPIAS